jgi:hypothetical protein
MPKFEALVSCEHVAEEGVLGKPQRGYDGRRAAEKACRNGCWGTGVEAAVEAVTNVNPAKWECVTGGKSSNDRVYHLKRE